MLLFLTCSLQQITFLLCAILLFLTSCIQILTLDDEDPRKGGGIIAGEQEVDACHHGGVAVPGAVLVVEMKMKK